MFLIFIKLKTERNQEWKVPFYKPADQITLVSIKALYFTEGHFGIFTAFYLSD